MGASDDEEEYIRYGRPLQEELESGRGQYSKEIQDKASTRALPVWQQEVVDDQGRRRLHGAFTGGYSAGYYNTVGSKEGWAPAAFKSSRDKRSEAKGQQTAEDFMDEDELEELGRRKIATVSNFDTFGHEAEERAKQAMLSSMQERPGLSVGIIKDLIAPVPDSVGIRLLQKMGWRQGKGIGKAQAKKQGQDGSRWGQMATVGADNVKIVQLPAKDNTHGLGYDPFKGAKEFEAAKIARNKDPSGEMPVKRKRGVAFGTGIMDEDDTLGMTDDYVTDLDPREGLDFELGSEEEEEEHRPFKRHHFKEQYRLPGKAESLRLQSKEDSLRGFDLIPGFIKAQRVETFSHFPAPTVPADFEPFYRFPTEGNPDPISLQFQDIKNSLECVGHEVGSEPPQPSSNILRGIRSIAPFVARVGPSFEALAIHKNASNPDFAFLAGGEGAEYYRWSVRSLRAAHQDTTGLVIGQRSRPLTANDRGILLGEDESQAALPIENPGQSNPVLTRHIPAGVAEGDKQALQEAMRATFTRGKKQDFEDTNPDLKDFGLRPGKPIPPKPQSSAAQAVLEAAKNRFASGTVLAPESAQGGLTIPTVEAPVVEKKVEARRLPKRTVIEWRPAPLLCKRFNVPDPFRGKPAYMPEAPQSKFDSLALPETAAAAAAKAASGALAVPISHQFGQSNPSQEAMLPLPPPPARPPPHVPSTAGSTTPAAKTSAGDFADSLLSSLLGEQTETTPGLSPTVPDQPPAAKPINIFQAIFEGDSEDEEDSDETEEPEGEQPGPWTHTREPDTLHVSSQAIEEPQTESWPRLDPGLGTDAVSREGGPGTDALQSSVKTGQRDEGRIRTGGHANPAPWNRETGVTASDRTLTTAILGSVNDGLQQGRTTYKQPTSKEIEEAMHLLNKSSKKEKHKSKDKKKKGDKEKKKSKSSKNEKKHHKARRKNDSSDD